MKVGDPEDEATEMGPLISAAHRETVASFVDGEPLFRGEAPDGAGFWFPCTLVEASNDDRIAREEVFGPGRGRDPVRRRGGRDPARERHAVRALRARSGRATARGRCGSRARSRRVSSRVNSNSSVRVSTPFGGIKQSGFGRELGMHALEGYSEVKNVFLSTEG